MYPIELKWKPRSEQLLMLDKFKKFVNSENKFMFIESPVGTGKSYAIMMMAEYYKSLHEGSNFDVLTNTKILQQQYLNDFDFVKQLKGAENYNCFKHSCTCAEGMQLNKINGSSCPTCKYSIAKLEYQQSEVGVLNFSMFLSLYFYNNEILINHGSKVLFIDEAHSFEESYCEFVVAQFNKTLLDSLDVWNDDWCQQYVDIKNINEYYDFLLNQVLPYLNIELTKLEKLCSSNPKDTGLLKTFKNITTISNQYMKFISDFDINKSNWVFERNESDNGWELKSQIVWGKQYLKEIYNMYDKVVFLSGTIIDKVFFSNLMGADLKNSMFMSVESPFKVENRPIIYRPIAKFSYNNKIIASEKIANEIKGILNDYLGVKGIIHSVSYETTNIIRRVVNNPRILTHTSKNKDEILAYHQNTKENTILLSPSMINGVDLKDDLSRLQIIVKMPYPNLSNNRVKARMNSNSKWYSWATMCAIIQQYGRSVRSETDYATTYILDANFDNILNNISLPKYLKEAIIFDNND